LECRRIHTSIASADKVDCLDAVNFPSVDSSNTAVAVEIEDVVTAAAFEVIKAVQVLHEALEGVVVDRSGDFIEPAGKRIGLARNGWNRSFWLTVTHFELTEDN